MTKQLINSDLPDTIYLIPADEGDYVWCDTPCPSDEHVESEAVKYVKVSPDTVTLSRGRVKTALLNAKFERFIHVNSFVNNLSVNKLSDDGIYCELKALLKEIG